MDTSTLAAQLHERRLQEQTVREAAEEAFQTPASQSTQQRPIEAPDRPLTIHPDLIALCDQLPTSLELIPHAPLIRYLLAWIGTFEGLVAGATD